MPARSSASSGLPLQNSLQALPVSSLHPWALQRPIVPHLHPFMSLNNGPFIAIGNQTGSEIQHQGYQSQVNLQTPFPVNSDVGQLSNAQDKNGTRDIEHQIASSQQRTSQEIPQSSTRVPIAPKRPPSPLHVPEQASIQVKKAKPEPHKVLE